MTAINRQINNWRGYSMCSVEWRPLVTVVPDSLGAAGWRVWSAGTAAVAVRAGLCGRRAAYEAPALLYSTDVTVTAADRTALLLLLLLDTRWRREPRLADLSQQVSQTRTAVLCNIKILVIV